LIILRKINIVRKDALYHKSKPKPCVMENIPSYIHYSVDNLSRTLASLSVLKHSIKYSQTIRNGLKPNRICKRAIKKLKGHLRTIIERMRTLGSVESSDGFTINFHQFNLNFLRKFSSFLVRHYSSLYACLCLWVYILLNRLVVFHNQKIVFIRRNISIKKIS